VRGGKEERIWERRERVKGEGKGRKGEGRRGQLQLKISGYATKFTSSTAASPSSVLVQMLIIMRAIC